jgi:hypothetical protein
MEPGSGSNPAVELAIRNMNLIFRCTDISRCSTSRNATTLLSPPAAGATP